MFHFVTILKKHLSLYGGDKKKLQTYTDILMQYKDRSLQDKITFHMILKGKQ